MTDKRIGTISDAGVEWPETTLSGRTYDRPPSQYRNIGGGRIVVLDPFPATDQYGNPLLDVEAEIAKLAPKPAPAAPKAKE